MKLNTKQLSKKLILQQIEHLEMIVGLMEEVDECRSQMRSKDAIISEYSEALQAAEATIGEKDALISSLQEKRDLLNTSIS